MKKEWAQLKLQSTARVYKQLLTSLQSQLFQHPSTSPISTFILGTLPFVIILYQVPGGYIRARVEAASSSSSSVDSKPNKLTLFPNDYMGKQTR